MPLKLTCATARSPRKFRALALLAVLLGSCSTTPPPRAYQVETFPSQTPFQYNSRRDPEDACEIGKRALLSQGYLIELAQTLNIRGEKYFRPLPDQATKLAITLVCLPGKPGAVIYANAMETQYQLKASATSAGISVSGLGSLSLPWGADKDTQVKVGETTITAADFYQRLFDLIKTLDG